MEEVFSFVSAAGGLSGPAKPAGDILRLRPKRFVFDSASIDKTDPSFSADSRSKRE